MTDKPPMTLPNGDVIHDGGYTDIIAAAKPTQPTDTRNRLAFAENAMLEDGMTPAQIRDHMRRYADVIDGQICGMGVTA